MADAHGAGAVAHADVAHPQGSDLADTQAGLQHELRHGVVPRGQAVRGSTGGAQQGVHLGVGQASRLAVARGAHGPDIARGVGSQGAGPARPPAQPAQGVQPPVDRGRAEASGDHVLAVGDQLVFGEGLQDEGAVMDRAMPGDEVTQVVAVAAQRRGCQVIARQTGGNAAIQLGSPGALAGVVRIARKVIPRVSTLGVQSRSMVVRTCP